MPTLRPLSISIYCAAIALAGSAQAADDGGDFFESHVRPLLIAKCVECHGPKKQESGLRLDSRAHMLVGTNDHSALVDQDVPATSRLLQVTAWSDDDIQMPPAKPLTLVERQILGDWIEGGAIWPESSEFGQLDEVRTNWQTHWAFQPVTDPEPPGPGHPIDAFVRERLLAQNITPSPIADAPTLVRRLSVAMVGLPPAMTDIEIAQTTPVGDVPELVSRVTDDLLESPHFGERWARYWLDVARYSDTKGYVFQEDRTYPDAWRYREWVINSLNSDMPWDEFLIRQLAADRFPEDQTPEDLAAMGFLTLGRRFLNNKHHIIDDRIDVTMRGMMGLTVACARCHDHKYDPVPTADYYSLYGVFDSSDEPKNEPSPLRLVDRPEPREPVIFVRGSAGRRGDAVPRQFLTSFTIGEPKPFSDGSGRLELGRAIASRDNPLTARVAVNRVWSHLFAEPLVDSPSDFGIRSDPPSHPQLLDYLATWFMDHDWSLKQLVRHIVTSETWMQSSNPRPNVEEIDPRNQLLARQSKRRLDFEAHRDAILATSGRLDDAIGGESVNITTQPFATRRTLYAHIDRQNLPGMFRTFDFASPDTHAPRRFETTVPQQALFQMNSPFILEMAEAAATEYQIDSPNATMTVQRLYRRILQRDASDDEAVAAVAFIDSDQPDSATGWSYGYGTISETLDQLESFALLPVFHDNVWQGGSELPDKTLNWASLRKDGGHPGNNRQLCAVRRWTAGRPAELTVRYKIKHANDDGDGVRFVLLQNQTSVLATESIHKSSKAGRVAKLSVVSGDIIDFAMFCGESSSHDTFRNDFIIEESTPKNRRLWNSVSDFSHRSEPRTTDAWTQLAQVLMLTNEFVFVD